MSKLDQLIDGILRRIMGNFPDPEQPHRLRRAQRVERAVQSSIRRGDQVRADYRRADRRIGR